MKKTSIQLEIDSSLAKKLNSLASKNFRTISGQVEYLIDKELKIERKEKDFEVMLKAHSAFTLIDGDLSPITEMRQVGLSDLKLYEREKNIVLNNTLNFLAGKPAQNTLLFGDKGTGKSATVQAIACELSDSPLRIVELKKRQLHELDSLTAMLHTACKNYKFIIFIDDLTLSSDSGDYSDFKTALDGSLGGYNNVLIYATSNRRNIVKESASDRDNDVHLNDVRQEQTSLVERFGLTVNFMKPGKKEFFEILAGILDDRAIEYDNAELMLRAEQFCLERGGRSCRVAKQLADIIECELPRR